MADPAIDQLRQQFLQSLPARTESPLWSSTQRVAVDDRERDESLRNLVNGTPTLNGLWDMRLTLRGQGKTPFRQFTLSSADTFGKDGLKLGIGAQGLPTLELAGLGGTMPSASLSLGRFTFGSTAPTSAINRMLQPYDAVMDSKSRPQGPLAFNESRLTWMSARPLETKSAVLDLVMVRGRRDLTPGQASGKKFTSGSLWGARGEYTLRSTYLKDWKLRSEWVKSSLSDQKSSATALKLGVDGPLRHPWGTAKFTANYSDLEAGFASFIGTTPENGRRNTQLALQQPFNLSSKITGNVLLNSSQIERQGPDLASLASGTAREAETMEAVVNGRWQFSSRVALTGSHVRRRLKQQMSAATPFAASFSKHSDSNIGLDFKLTPSLSLAVSSGITRAGDDVLWVDADKFAPLFLRDEDRLTASLNYRTKRGSLSLRLDRKSIDDPITRQINTESQAMGLEAEHQVFSWLKLKGSWRIAGEDDTAKQLVDNSMQYSTQAQFSLKKWGQLDLNYGDWGRSRHVLNALGLSEDKNEYGLRYTVGARGNDPGLGLSLEYSRCLATHIKDDKKFRFMLTYR